MNGNLKQLTAERKSGKERFRSKSEPLGFDLLSFWQWSVSDLVSNATRGRLAEYIVARALGIGVTDIREEWAAYDLETGSGIKIEVKSAAYVQSWNQKGLSKISFLTRKTLAWDPESNLQAKVAKRQADVYVFALLTTQDQLRIDPLDLDQWRFFVLPTSDLDNRTRSQHS
ncbi:MAG: hypothetical protein ACHQ50_03260, partial [Fimbriimonadales bacterium]